MNKIFLPKVIDNIFEITLKPSVKRDTLGEENQGQIEILKRKKNRVTIGEPYFRRIDSEKADENIKIPPDILQMMGRYDFFFISLSCSFLPDPDCKFMWSRLFIKLYTDKKPETPQDRPIAWEIFPDKIETEIKHSKSIKISPDLKFQLGKLAAEGNLFEIITQKDYSTYEPIIFSFGRRHDEMGWDFKSHNESGIWGNKSNLFLIVRTPQRSNLKGRFTVSAEIQCQRFPRLKIFSTSKREDGVINCEYSFYEQKLEIRNTNE